MKLLVVHPGFPGQFGPLVQAWARRPGWDVRGLGQDTAPGLRGFDTLHRYTPSREVSPTQHRYLRQMEAATLHGQAAAREMLVMKHAGFTPDVIVAHPGRGETLYAKDVFPNVRLVHLCEWYYQADSADLQFDPEFPLSFDDRARIRTWNALHTLNLTQCDVGVSPTHWQRGRHPASFQPKIRVQHEGIDTVSLGQDPSVRLVTPSGVSLSAGDPVVTYVARNLEPYRGFHVFMRALERVQRAHPHCHALIVGGDEVSYGRKPKGAAHWREKMTRELSLDPVRTHFVGRLRRPQYVRILQISAAHVHLTYPFVLSGSLLEAMACGAPLVASNTAPVREVMQHGVHGSLVDFFDVDAVAEAMLDRLERPGGIDAMRAQAMRSAAAYSRDAALDGYDALLQGDAPGAWGQGPRGPQAAFAA